MSDIYTGDLPEITLMSDTDVVKSTSASGLDSRINRENLSKSINTVLVPCGTTVTTIDLSAYIGDISVIISPNSTGILTLTNLLVEGQRCILYNDGETSTTTQEEITITYTAEDGSHSFKLAKGSNAVLTSMEDLYMKLTGGTPIMWEGSAYSVSIASILGNSGLDVYALWSLNYFDDSSSRYYTCYFDLLVNDDNTNTYGAAGSAFAVYNWAGGNFSSISSAEDRIKRFELILS